MDRKGIYFKEIHMADRAVEHTSGLGCWSDAQLHGVLDQLDQEPLMALVRRLCDNDKALAASSLVNLAAKYFFAFVHPGAQENPVPVDEIVSLMNLHARCKSLNEPDDNIEIMNILRQHGPSLGLAADAGRAALVLMEMLHQSPAPGPRFLGLDIHTGSGLLALGQYIMARRLDKGTIQIWGMERDPDTAERAGQLLRALGAGNVVTADPSDVDSYSMLGGMPVSMVSTPLLTGESASLSDERFFGSYAALFEALGKSAEASVFFPEGLIAYSRDMNASLVFSKDNGYQRPPEYAQSEFQPQGLLVDGRVLPLHRLASGIRNILR